jgi:hypothetical protein
MIEAQYVTEAGERKQSLLLISGWWGLARHFHYAPEIAAAFLWSVPALFTHVSHSSTTEFSCLSLGMIFYVFALS